MSWPGWSAGERYLKEEEFNTRCKRTRAARGTGLSPWRSSDGEKKFLRNEKGAAASFNR